LAGLYAAGEAACVSINGANRLGSNSLTEILVFGARAGRAAAAYATSVSAPAATAIDALAADEQRRLDRQFLKKEGGKERIATLRQEMQTAMEEGAGIYRDQAKMEETCKALRGLRGRFKDIIIEDRGSTFNTEVMSALELDYMLDVAETVANSALMRKESRGSHTRTDFPKRDDENFLKHTLAYRTPDGPKIEYLPVTITRWAPEERKY
jgi:fumarate reductase flavoprotein subunit